MQQKHMMQSSIQFLGEENSSDKEFRGPSRPHGFVEAEIILRILNFLQTTEPCCQAEWKVRDDHI